MPRLATAVMSLAVAVLVLVAPPASAGGPTSVLLVNYDGSRSAGALTGSAAYADLEKALDVYNAPSGQALGRATFMDTAIRLTWLIHDVTPWRVDAISIDGADVWVETAANFTDSTRLFDAPMVRHRAKDPDLLLTTLAALGIIDAPDASAPTGSASPSGRGVGPAGSSGADATEAALATPVPQGAGAGPDSGGAPWWTAVTAALLALGLGVVLGRRVRPGVGRAAGQDGLPGPGAPDLGATEDVSFTTDGGRAHR